MSQGCNSLKSYTVKETMKQGKRLSLPPFRIYYTRAENEKIGLTIIISKKICKLATKRNRIRRCVREAIRSIPLQNGNYVFYLAQAIDNPSTILFQTLFKTSLLKQS